MTNKPFIHENFLLQSETAQHLFHDHAKKLPIIDYHCHLNPQEVASDHKFRSITELWLGGDHYKWRALRTNGVAEKFITGDASDWDKFQKWAETMPYCMRNSIRSSSCSVLSWISEVKSTLSSGLHSSASNWAKPDMAFSGVRMS